MKEKNHSIGRENIIVKFEHLNPKIQGIIQPIRMQRFYRGGYELFLLGNLWKLYITSSAAHLKIFPTIHGAGILVSLGLREKTVNIIKKAHRDLVDSIKRKDLLSSEFKEQYPKGWKHSATVAMTHPSFHVKANGDIVFHKTTKEEFFRIKFQEKFNRAAWRWRAFLEPPVAPQKTKDWTRLQIEKIKRKIKRTKPRKKPRKRPVPVLAPAYSRKIKRPLRLRFA